MSRIGLGVGLLLVALGCGMQNYSPSAKLEFLRFNAVGAVTPQTMVEIETTMVEHSPEILEHLGVQAMPPVSVFVWQIRKDFESRYGSNTSYVRGFIDPDKFEVHVLNTSQSPAMGTIHEYVHLVLLRVNATISHNPKWLWETVAIYESNRPPPPEVQELACLTASGVPHLSDLNIHSTNIYRVGYYLGDFVVSKWGWPGMRRLIQANGDTEMGLEVSEKEFEAMWLQHMNSQYKLRQGVPAADC